MIVNRDTKICVGDTFIKEVYQGENKIYDNIPYIKLNYIESTGTQYIDTLISGGSVAEYEIVFNPLRGRLYYEQYFAGDLVTIGQVGKLYLENTVVIYQNSYGTSSVQVGPNNTTYTVKVSCDTGVTVEDSVRGTTVLYQTYEGFPWGTLSFWVFGSHSEPNLKPTMRLYGLKMYTDGVKVRDFIPVLDKENIPCLYDKVSKTLFYNKGTGTFLYG